jgi:hypothetical protein
MPDAAVTSPQRLGSRVLQVVGGILAAAVLLLEVSLGAVFVYAWFWPWPPAWPGVFISLVAALLGPLAAFLAWRAGRRRFEPTAVVLRRTELAGIGAGLVGLVAIFAMLLIAAPF